MGRPKKIKLEEAHQTHGQVEKPVTLDQIWGDSGLGTYGTLDEAVYIDKLNKMDKADLQAHASKMNLVPIDDVSRLKATLLKYFRLHVSSFRRPVVSKKTMTPDEEVQKILAEGR